MSPLLLTVSKSDAYARLSIRMLGARSRPVSALARCTPVLLVPGWGLVRTPMLIAHDPVRFHVVPGPSKDTVRTLIIPRNEL
jgi:hypothetical protein